MKRLRRSRDDGRFALTTLQNPTLEVCSRSELIAAAQEYVAEEACSPRRDAAVPATGVPSEQNSPAPAKLQQPQQDSPEPSPQTLPPRRNPFPVRMEVRTSPSGEMEFRYVCGEKEPPPFAPICDAATRARLAKHFAEERAKAFRATATESPTSSISVGIPESSEPPTPSPAEESDKPALPITWTNPSYPITTYNLRPDYSSATPSSNSSPRSAPLSQPTSPDFNRHSRRCAICGHRTATPSKPISSAGAAPTKSSGTTSSAADALHSTATFTPSDSTSAANRKWAASSNPSSSPWTSALRTPST